MNPIIKEKKASKIDKRNIPLYSNEYEEIEKKEKNKRRMAYLKVKEFSSKFSTLLIFSFYLVLFLLIYWYFNKIK